MFIAGFSLSLYFRKYLASSNLTLLIQRSQHTNTQQIVIIINIIIITKASHFTEKQLLTIQRSGGSWFIWITPLELALAMESESNITDVAM